MADLILANGEKIAKFTKINSLQNYLLYGILAHTNSQVANGKYRYTRHLLALERCVPTDGSVNRMVTTPLVADAWEAGLSQIVC